MAEVKQVEPVPATELRENWSDFLNRVAYRGEAFDVVRNGKVVARLIPPEEHAA